MFDPHNMLLQAHRGTNKRFLTMTTEELLKFTGSKKGHKTHLKSLAL